MKVLRRLRQDWVLYAMLSRLCSTFIFHIIPLYGMKLAFQDYRILGDHVWVGWKHFKTLFSSPAFTSVAEYHYHQLDENRIRVPDSDHAVASD